jgi:prolyl oligopeptidase
MYEAIVVGALLLTATSPALTPPPTRTDEVVDTLHGVKVPDPYRWLEKADSDEVESWTQKQNAHMRKLLDSVPERQRIADRLWQLYEIGALGVPVAKGEGKRRRYFFTRRTGKQNQPVLYLREGGARRSRTGGGDGDRTLVDVNQLSVDGTRALDWWFPSEDGRYVAYGVSANGDEESVLKVREVASGEDLPDVITRTRFCSVAWLPDSKGFYYTRYPLAGTVPPGEEKYHRSVHFHRLGTDPALDPKIFGEGRDLKDSPTVALSPDGRWLAIQVAQGWARTELFLLDTRKPGPPAPAPVVTGRDAIYRVAEVLDDRLYLVSNEGAPRYRVFAVDPRKPAREGWKEIIPEGPDTLESIHYVGGRLAAHYLRDAASRVRLFDTRGKLLREVALPGLGTAADLSGQLRGRELFFSFASFLTPTIVFRHDLDERRTLKGFRTSREASRRGNLGGSARDERDEEGATTVWERLSAPIDPAGFEVSQVRYPSRDGTQIPMFLVHRKGLVRDGNNPTMLYGYGGFNISLTPSFAAYVAPFIEKGGVYAVANLRGGAEYGEAWHQAGMLGKKQNVFDDFIAAAEYLIREKITSPARLAISGRSNGGLLTAAALTQRPELFRAVISGVPLTDMLRYHKFRIAQLWIPEYGSADSPEAFRWLYQYSPYHRVKNGVDYPAVLIFTAESDTRVDAMHARKMAARLQAATSGQRPIVLRLESKAGHGAGKPLRKLIEQYTDELAFLFGQLDLASGVL